MFERGTRPVSLAGIDAPRVARRGEKSCSGRALSAERTPLADLAACSLVTMAKERREG